MPTHPPACIGGTLDLVEIKSALKKLQDESEAVKQRIKAATQKMSELLHIAKEAQVA